MRKFVRGGISVRWRLLESGESGRGEREVEGYRGQGRAEDWYQWTTPLIKGREGEEVSLLCYLSFLF